MGNKKVDKNIKSTKTVSKKEKTSIKADTKILDNNKKKEKKEKITTELNKKTSTKKKKKLKYKNIFMLFFASVLIIGGSAFLIRYNNIKKEQRLLEEKLIKEKIERENLIAEIKSSFSEYVITNKETELFELKNNSFQKIGNVSKGYEFFLEEPEEIDVDTKYFKIKTLDLYIHYKDIDKIDSIKNNNKRYKEYVVFNENVYTKDVTTFYKDEKTYIQLNKAFNLPIIIKDNNKYYVEYNDELFYLKKKEIKKVKNKNNTKEKTRNNIRTLTYHTIYDPKNEKCTNTVICHPISQFEAHMKYLSDNNYLTLTMEELEMFLDKKIQIPKKSVVITLDDGKYAKNAVDIVEKYKVYATYFIITSKYNVSEIKTTYMDFQSHTHNLHNNWKCKGGNQGGQILCEAEDKILKDLKTSQEKLGGAFALAYPYFDFNERAITLLKKSGFRLAFVGQYDTDGYSYLHTDRFKIRRKTIFSYDSINKFISYLN